MSEQSNSSDKDLDGIKATREGTKQPSNQEGRILPARREEGGGGGRGRVCDGCYKTNVLK